MYASPGQRFVTRASRIRHDLAFLVSYSLAHVQTQQGRIIYLISERGRVLAGNFNSIYAHSYRESAAVIGSRIRILSDTKLRDSCRRWLKADPSLLDLYNI
ncbi:ABC-three component system middle component 2 [Acrocarpospora pleiomorpha]|uniref:ABC-three component system middle component 2 n=1 Tax=Acrocarpospora pleiomorpha TaxID=90975 RepID=UPI0035A22603